MKWYDDLVELFCTDQIQSESRLFECCPLPVGFLGDLSRFIVSDVRAQRRNEHERILDVFGYDWFICDNTFNTMGGKTPASIGQ